MFFALPIVSLLNSYSTNDSKNSNKNNNKDNNNSNDKNTNENSNKNDNKKNKNNKSTAKALSLMVASWFPERAPAKKQSFLAAVLRFPLPKTIMLEHFSLESSISSLHYIFTT